MRIDYMARKWRNAWPPGPHSRSRSTPWPGLLFLIQRPQSTSSRTSTDSSNTDADLPLLEAMRGQERAKPRSRRMARSTIPSKSPVEDAYCGLKEWPIARRWPATWCLSVAFDARACIGTTTHVERRQLPSCAEPVGRKFNSWTKRAPILGDASHATRWHSRLSHPGPEALEHVVTCAQGLHLKGAPTTVECEACGVAKAKRVIPREPRSIDQGPGEHLAIDFHEFETERGPKPHLMLITDRWSGYTGDLYLQNRYASTVIDRLATIFGD